MRRVIAATHGATGFSLSDFSLSNVPFELAFLGIMILIYGFLLAVTLVFRRFK